MIKSHGYRYGAQVTNPNAIYEIFESNLTKGFNPNDKGKNCIFRTDDVTLQLSFKSGKITFYTNKNKKEFLKWVKNTVEPSLFNEIQHSLQLQKREIREYRHYLRNKSGYCDYVIYSNSLNLPPPLPSSNLQKMLKLDFIDIKLLKYVYDYGGINTTYARKVFKLNYYTAKRRLDKLKSLSLVEKIGKNPAQYIKVSNNYRALLISQFVYFWVILFLMANLQKVQNNPLQKI
ncbi:MAG: hypothetical protein QXI58_02400 [Candidatus Micrarchaeia archaeon]